ncbi:hypothetical protein Tco_1283908 [Tanacetum coccineum]
MRIRCASFEALYGRKCRSPVIWVEIGGSSLIGPELVQEMTDKVVLIKEKLKAVRDRQKSLVIIDANSWSLRFRVMLKVSLWKGVVHFRKKGKLASRYVGPFENLERIGPVAYWLRLPEELSGVHDTFHVSNLKKCLADASLHVPLDEIKVDKTLRFVEEPVENSDCEVMRLKCSRMVIVKVWFWLEARSLRLQFLFDELQDRVVNDVVTQLMVLTSFLDDGRGSGSWMFLFVWSGYAAMRTLLWVAKVVSGKQLIESLFLDIVVCRKPMILAQLYVDVLSIILRNTKESWVLLEDLSLYDNESWNDPRDFAKPVKAISLPQDVSSTSDRRIIELKNQVQRLMEAHLAPKQPIQVNKITFSCEICSGPHDTQYCMENIEQAFVDYTSSYTDKAGDARFSKFEADFKQQQREMTNKIDTVLKAITDQMAGALPSDTVKNPKLNVNSTSSKFSARSCPTEDPQCSTHIYNSINTITICPKRSSKLQNGNFTYVINFMIVKDITSIIDPRLSQVVLGRPFVEMSNMTHDPPEGVGRFTNGTDEIAYKMPHKIEQYNSLSDLEREHTKSVYLRCENDKRRGAEYVMSKILGFYKECLKLGPEYVTGIADEGEIM